MSSLIDSKEDTTSYRRSMVIKKIENLIHNTLEADPSLWKAIKCIANTEAAKVSKETEKKKEHVIEPKPKEKSKEKVSDESMISKQTVVRTYDGLELMQGCTLPMHIIQIGLPLENTHYHDPTMRNAEGETVAMLLARQYKQIPKQWRHDPTLQDSMGMTVAMIFASRKMPIPSEWIHDKNIKNNQKQTIIDILRMHNQSIPLRLMLQMTTSQKMVAFGFAVVSISIGGVAYIAGKK